MTQRVKKQSPPIYPAWLQDLVEEWRQRLIPEWTVILTTHHLDQDEDPPTYGESQAEVVYKRLKVWINMEPPTAEAEERRRSIEETLVHEILHGALEPLDDAYRPPLEHMGCIERKLVNRAVEGAVEPFIEQLSRLLVALKYGEGDSPKLRLMANGEAR
jgi:hypothetical protein